MKKIIILFSLILFMFVACTPNYNKQMMESEQFFYKGKYLKAAKLLLPLVNKKSKNQLLFMMECGSMLHAGEDYKKSNKVFIPAEKLYPKLGVSVSKQIGSVITNERAANYRGENFELVLIHLFAGLNFYQLGDPDSARVEFLKVTHLLKSFKMEKNREYDQNLLAKYMAAICYEMLGDIDKDYTDWEFAYIELKQIYELNKNLPYLGQDLMRVAKKLDDNQEFAGWQRKYGRYRPLPKNSADLVVVFQAGQAVIKKSRGKLLKDANFNGAIRVSISGMSLQQGVTSAGIIAALAIAENPIPKFKRRSNKIDHLNIYVDGRRVGRTFKLVDVDETAFLTMEDKYDKVMAKTAAGIVVKVAASLAAAYIAKESAKQIGGTVGAFSGLIGAATGAAVGTGFASQIKPDLRCWHTLPSNFQFLKSSLTVGDHVIKIDYIDKAGNVADSVEKEVKVEKDKDVVLNIRTTY